MERIPLVSGDRFGHHLDAGWIGGHAERRRERRASGSAGDEFQPGENWLDCVGISAWSCVGFAAVWIPDGPLGPEELFFLTLGVYLLGTLLTAFLWNFWSFAAFRFITGSGIGGEYAAISSAIDELIPAAFRGRVNLMVNGSYWLGAGLGSLSTLIILDPHILNPKLGWRLGFATGALLGLLILLLRRHVPESPRWLMTHGDEKDAESAMREIEQRVEESTDEKLPEPQQEAADHSSTEKLWLRRSGQDDAAEISRPGGAELVADHVAGVPVQRGLFHLRAHSHAVLWRAGRAHRNLPASFCRWEFSRTTVAGAVLRYGGAAGDDFVDIRDIGGAVEHYRMGLRARDAFGKFADAALDDHFLFRIGGRQRGIFNGERDLSAGDSRVGDCFLFLIGNSGGRNRGAVAVWRADRLGFAGKSVLWIPGGGRSDARGSGH